MTNVKSDDRRLEILLDRHIAADNRWIDKMEKAEAKVEKLGLIGELCREGKTVYYINLVNRKGRMTGKTKEGTQTELIEYIMRNHYI